jgi:DNA-binding transcriptional ArsR family regulator
MKEDMETKDRKLIKILKAVASENRFIILRCLRKDKELSVGDLAEITNSPFRSVSNDLAVLRNAGLVQSRNSYSKRLYSINISNFPKELFQYFLE